MGPPAGLASGSPAPTRLQGWSGPTILEVNPNQPYDHGAGIVHVSQVDAIVENARGVANAGSRRPPHGDEHDHVAT
jgi:hypothetical protein